VPVRGVPVAPSPAGGLCHWPTRPSSGGSASPAAGRTASGTSASPGRSRAYNGLHPIRDRAALEALVPAAIRLAKELKPRLPRYKYRNTVITETGTRAEFQSAGPRM
jgi:hypothetical protein